MRVLKAGKIGREYAAYAAAVFIIVLGCAFVGGDYARMAQPIGEVGLVVLSAACVFLILSNQIKKGVVVEA